MACRLTRCSASTNSHGESERKFKEVLEAVTKLDGCVLFIDEAEAFFPSRGNMYGSTHNIPEKLLSQLLTFLEGFKADSSSKTIVLFASNRQSDLDPALLSRCTSVVPFKLPDLDARAAIWARYAAQLSADDLHRLAAATKGFAGRDIKKVAEMVEKRHTATLVRALSSDSAAAERAPVSETQGAGEAPSDASAADGAAVHASAPDAALYLQIVEDRRDHVLSTRSQRTGI